MARRERSRGGARPQASRSVRWVPIATYRAVYEAEIGRAVLEAGGFDAVVQGGEWVGIFGAGFQGITPRGVAVLVPSLQLAAARTYLAFRDQARSRHPEWTPLEARDEPEQGAGE